ncbi:hypothetical protein LSAT2_000467 [Lamellibrachia satsuma]|nr:hypothetical protein LSAT2_000467 [Lamellibrachia satsuma]
MSLVPKIAVRSLEAILRRGTPVVCVRSVVSWKRHGTFKYPDTPAPDKDLLWRTEDRRSLSHRESPTYPNEYEEEFPSGKIYDKKPFRMELKAGKKYSFCTCGYSKHQPMCDGWHKRVEGTTFEKTTPKYRPMKFTVDETKEYWLCNCKQSNNRPFCDGTHKKEDIQEAVK